MFRQKHITVIVPAHNEAEAIGAVLQQVTALTDGLSDDPLFDSIIVCDNASTDSTAEIARQWDCTVVYEPKLGYGAACQAAIRAAGRTDIFVFVDADRSIEVGEAVALVTAVAAGADLAIGSRHGERVEPGAMSIPQRFGNSLASALIRWLWRQPISDLGPFRAISASALRLLQMRDRRCGWTVEMQVRAVQERMTVVELPVHCRKRVGRSKISGTVRGVVVAGYDILTTIFRLYRAEHRSAVVSPGDRDKANVVR